MNTSIPPALFAPRAAAPGMAGDPLAVARTALLGPADLDEDSVARVLGDVMGHAVDYADAYFQLIREESWALEDGIVKDGAHSIDQGVGVRALAGEKTGFAYSDEVMLPAMLEAARAARAIARAGHAGSVQAWRAQGGRGLYLPIDPVETLDDDAKVKLLEAVDREAGRPWCRFGSYQRPEPRHARQSLSAGQRGVRQRKIRDVPPHRRATGGPPGTAARNVAAENIPATPI